MGPTVTPRIPPALRVAHASAPRRDPGAGRGGRAAATARSDPCVFVFAFAGASMPPGAPSACPATAATARPIAHHAETLRTCLTLCPFLLPAPDAGQRFFSNLTAATYRIPRPTSPAIPSAIGLGAHRLGHELTSLSPERRPLFGQSARAPLPSISPYVPGYPR